MSLPAFGKFAPMNIQGPRHLTLPYPLCTPCAENANPHDEVLIRHVMARGAGVPGLVRLDNTAQTVGTWSADKNPEPGQLLRTVRTPAPGLQGGVADIAMALKIDPQTRQPECLTQTSSNGNFYSHLEWDGTELSQVSEKRIRSDGRVETLTMVIDKQKGTISYAQDIQ